MAKKKTERAPKAGGSAKPKKAEKVVPVPTGENANVFEKYDIRKVHRSELVNAPYNPRQISDTARKRLLQNIKRVGLIDPPIWNERTGNLVGGHQRISILDTLHGTKDYEVRVVVVDLSEKEEMEQNVFLNNPETQGYYDMNALHKLYKEYQIGYEESGFNGAEIMRMFGDAPIIEQPEMLVEMADKVRAAQATFDKIMHSSFQIDENDPNFYAIVVFETTEVRLKFQNVLGLGDDRHIDGRDLISLLGPDGLSESDLTIATGRYVAALLSRLKETPSFQREEVLENELRAIRQEMNNMIGHEQEEDDEASASKHH